jgi:elongation factor Ts
MAEITAASVKALRERTQLPLMDCKEALKESGGDQEAAIEYLRKKGVEIGAKRSGRATEFGTFGLFTCHEKGVGAIVELMCESAPVTKNEQFLQLALDLAQQLAEGPGAADGQALLAQDSPSQKGDTLQQQKDDLFNKIREVFNVGRIARIEGTCGGYVHMGSNVVGVLIEVEGKGEANDIRDVGMHVAAMSPEVTNVDQLDAEVVSKEREILRDAAIAEGKPENIVDKMVEGRLRNFYSQCVLNEQPFVKAEDGKTSVGDFAKEKGFKVKQFIRWELGKTEE